MPSLQPQQGRAGDPQVHVGDRLALEAAARRGLSDADLQEPRAVLVGFVAAGVPVDLVDLVVAAPKAGQTFHAHRGREVVLSVGYI